MFISLNQSYVNNIDAHPVVGALKPPLNLLSLPLLLTPFFLLPFDAARYYYENTKRVEDEQVVVLMRILQDQVNAGFSQEDVMQLLSLNGHPIRNLRHLINEVEHCKEPFLDFHFDSGEHIVLETGPAKRSTERILKAYGIRSAKSVNFISSKTPSPPRRLRAKRKKELTDQNTPKEQG